MKIFNLKFLNMKFSNYFQTTVVDLLLPDYAVVMDSSI